MVFITKLQAVRENLEFKTRKAATPRQQGARHCFASQSSAKLLIPAAQQLGLLANALGPTPSTSLYCLTRARHL